MISVEYEPLISLFIILFGATATEKFVTLLLNSLLDPLLLLFSFSFHKKIWKVGHRLIDTLMSNECNIKIEKSIEINN